MTVGRKGVLELHSSDLPRFYICFIRRSTWSFPHGIHPELSRLLAACLHTQQETFIHFSQLLIHFVHTVRPTHLLSWSIHPLVILHSFTSSSSPAFVTVAPLPSPPPLWSEGKCARGASRCRSGMHLRLWQRRDIEWCARALIAYRKILITSLEVFGFDRVSVSSFMMLVASCCWWGDRVSAEVGSTSCTRD